MGGTSTSQTTQQSSTTPWDTGQNVVNGIVGALNPLVQNSGLNSVESNAIAQLEQNAAAGNPYSGQIGGVASNLLNGGGATNQAGAINNAYSQYVAQTNPLASNTNYNPMSTPGFSDALNTANSDITNQINGQFAAAGRSGSGANTQTLARGLTQGDAALIANQYNQNVQNQQGAAQNLYNAGNATSGLLSGLTQQGVNNQLQGIGAANSALTAQNYGPTAALAAAELGQSIPAQNLGLLAQIGIPIAGLGTNSSGTSNTTNNASLTSQIASLGGLLGAGPSTGANGAVSGGSGILGLLGFL
jgi:hypothetical protein